MNEAMPLTVRGVKTLLTRAGVPYTGLELVRHTYESLAPGHEGTIHAVRITGPREARRAATSALLDAGLTCATYPDHATWTRRR